MFRKCVFLSVVMVMILSLFACGGDDSATESEATPSCAEPAEGVSIDPDPAFLGQPLTTAIEIPSITTVFLEYIVIRDASRNTVREYQSSNPILELPIGVTVSSGRWIINETFTSGTPGRWTLEGQYQSTSLETKTFSGSFCVNEKAASGVKITGDVVKESSTSQPSKDVAPPSRIVFSSDRDGNFEIYVMDADGSNKQRLTNDPASDEGASWSPDGSRIAFTFFSKPRPSYCEIYVMDADGSNQQRLTNNSAYDGCPSWSP